MKTQPMSRRAGNASCLVLIVEHGHGTSWTGFRLLVVRELLPVGHQPAHQGKHGFGVLGG